MPLVLGGLLVSLLPILAAIVLLGLSKSATATHGSSTSGTFWDFITGKAYLHQLSGFAANFARWLASHFAGAQLRVLGRWLLHMGTLTIGVFTVGPVFAEAVAEALERVVHRGDPKARAKASTANTRAIHAGKAADHANTHAKSVGHALDKYKGRTNVTIKHHSHAIAVTIPQDIARVRDGEDALSRDLAKLRARTKALEDGAADTFDWIRAHPLSGVTAVFAGAVAVALSRMGFGFLRCNNWKNLGKRITCGMGAWLSALLDLIATFGLGLLAVLKPEVLAEETVAAVDSIEFLLAEILNN